MTPPETPELDPMIRVRRIQPLIDGELDPATAAAVRTELAKDPDLMDMVEEQESIRALLHRQPRETAPASLRSRILLDLDALEMEEMEAQHDQKKQQAQGDQLAEHISPPELMKPPHEVSGLRRALRGALRSGLVFVPAAAAATLLFVLSRGDLGLPAPSEFSEFSESPAAQDLVAAAAPAEDPASDPMMSLGTLAAQPLTGAAVPATAGIDLVSLGGADPRGRTPEIVEYPLDDHGGRALLLRLADRGDLVGSPRRFRGRLYYLGRDRRGQPWVMYDSDGGTHVLVSARGGDLLGLLELGDRLRERSETASLRRGGL